MLSSALLAAIHLSTDRCTFTILGTSNVHDWSTESTAGIVSGDMVLDGIKLASVSNIHIKVPVKTIKSDKGSVMDNKTWKALKSDKHPNIIFNMTALKSLTKAPKGYDIVVTGKLNIAGVIKTVDLNVHGLVLTGNRVLFTGSKKIKMTDYGIDPPTAFFGAMTTGDEITLKYDIILKP